MSLNLDQKKVATKTTHEVEQYISDIYNKDNFEEKDFKEIIDSFTDCLKETHIYTRDNFIYEYNSNHVPKMFRNHDIKNDEKFYVLCLYTSILLHCISKSSESDIKKYFGEFEKKKGLFELKKFYDIVYAAFSIYINEDNLFDYYTYSIIDAIREDILSHVLVNSSFFYQEMLYIFGKVFVIKPIEYNKFVFMNFENQIGPDSDDNNKAIYSLNSLLKLTIFISKFRCSQDFIDYIADQDNLSFHLILDHSSILDYPIYFSTYFTLHSAIINSQEKAKLFYNLFGKDLYTHYFDIISQYTEDYFDRERGGNNQVSFNRHEKVIDDDDRMALMSLFDLISSLLINLETKVACGIITEYKIDRNCVLFILSRIPSDLKGKCFGCLSNLCKINFKPVMELLQSYNLFQINSFFEDMLDTTKGYKSMVLSYIAFVKSLVQNVMYNNLNMFNIVIDSLNKYIIPSTFYKIFNNQELSVYIRGLCDIFSIFIYKQFREFNVLNNNLKNVIGKLQEFVLSCLRETRTLSCECLCSLFFLLEYLIKYEINLIKSNRGSLSFNSIRESIDIVIVKKVFSAIGEDMPKLQIISVNLLSLLFDLLQSKISKFLRPVDHINLFECAFNKNKTDAENLMVKELIIEFLCGIGSESLLNHKVCGYNLQIYPTSLSTFPIDRDNSILRILLEYLKFDSDNIICNYTLFPLIFKYFIVVCNNSYTLHSFLDFLDKEKKNFFTEDFSDFCLSVHRYHQDSNASLEFLTKMDSALSNYFKLYLIKHSYEIQRGNEKAKIVKKMFSEVYDSKINSVMISILQDKKCGNSGVHVDLVAQCRSFLTIIFSNLKVDFSAYNILINHLEYLYQLVFETVNISLIDELSKIICLMCYNLVEITKFSSYNLNIPTKDFLINIFNLHINTTKIVHNVGAANSYLYYYYSFSYILTSLNADKSIKDKISDSLSGFESTYIEYCINDINKSSICNNGIYKSCSCMFSYLSSGNINRFISVISTNNLTVEQDAHYPEIISVETKNKYTLFIKYMLSFNSYKVLGDNDFMRNVMELDIWNLMKMNDICDRLVEASSVVFRAVIIYVTLARSSEGIYNELRDLFERLKDIIQIIFSLPHDSYSGLLNDISNLVEIVNEYISRDIIAEFRLEELLHRATTRN